MRYKKSQSAIEFLSTYSWAILIFLILIGALIYFGFFNLEQFVQADCDFGPQMECQDFAVGSDGTIMLNIRNNFGEPIVIENVYSSSHTIDTIVTTPTINAGLSDVLEFTVSDSLLAGEKTRFRVAIGFRNDVPGATSYNTSGLIITKICDGGKLGPTIVGC